MIICSECGMNKNAVALIAPAALAIGFTVKEIFKTRRIEQKKRDLIQKNLEKFVDEIHHGVYDGKRVADVLEGYEFHRMTSRQY